MYLVWDRIEGAGDSVWNLHTLSTGAEITAQSIDAACLGGMRLCAHIAEPALPVITAGEGAVGGGHPLAVQQHFRVHGSGGDYLVLLHPRGEQAPALRLEPLDRGTTAAGVRMYKATRPDGAWFAVADNGSGQTCRVSIPGRAPLRLLGAADLSAAAGVAGIAEDGILSLEPGTIAIAVPLESGQ